MNSDTAKTIPVKFRLAGGSCRRARLNIPMTMAMVTHKLKTSFPELKSGQFSIKYRDEEGDEIEVVTDTDLTEAMAVFNAIDRVLSFTIEMLPSSAMLPSATNNGGSCRNHRWHHLAHMLGLRPTDMQPQMQDMFRFGMLRYFIGNGMAEHKGLQCTFVADATIPDGSIMQPHQRFDKTWVVKSGKNAWPAGCSLVHVGGHPMGTKRRKFRPGPLEAMAPDSEVKLTVTLQAPKCTRDFVSKWRMCTPDGLQFGNYLWAAIHVDRREDVETGLECKFVADATIPDGSIVQPQQRFDKTWVVKSGKNAWPAGCTLVHLTGHAMGTKRHKFRPAPLEAVTANSEVKLTVALQAPKCTRDFVSKWRMCTPDGRKFGDDMWIFINVEQKESSASAANETGLTCKFVADGSIPDRSTMQPKQRFNKKWVVKTGMEPWPAGCTLVHVGGHPMGTKRPKFKPAPMGAVTANSEVELTVTLKAPKPSRAFVSKWRMSTPDGRQFGDYLWALINVGPNEAGCLEEATEAKQKQPELVRPVPAAAAAAAGPVSAVASVVVAATPETPAAVAWSPANPKPVSAAASSVVAAVSPVTPPVAVPVSAPSAQVQQLLDMGFALDPEVLASVLASTGGDVRAAVATLLRR